LAPPDPADLGVRTVRLGRRELIRYVEKHQALAEACEISAGKSSGTRHAYVIDLTRYFDGERDGYVVLERPAKGRELDSACALVFAL
ncbi:MAG: hypothetical protein AB1762_14225, partial [Gemmatimonadota bacterium]